MDLSYQEKSTLGSLLITAALYGAYFIDVYEELTSDMAKFAESFPSLLLGVVIAVVVVEIVYEIAISIGSSGDAEDERDKLIAAKAIRFSYYILASGCVTTVGYILVMQYAGEIVGQSSDISLVLAANLVIFSFVLAEVVGYSMRLYYYRQGV